MSKKMQSYIWLTIGSALLVIFGWRWNTPIAVWLMPVFLIRFFRDQKRWPTTLIAVPVMTLGLFFNLTGSWDFSVPAELGISLLRATPLLIALYADRTLIRRMKPLPGSFVFPSVYVVLDYLIALSPLGTVFSMGVTQFSASAFVQMAAVTGIWGIGFVVGWCASVVNLIWEHDFHFRKAGPTAAIMPATLGVILLLGGMRLSVMEPESETVRVAGIIVSQERDYYAEVIDRGTPQDVAHRFEDEFDTLTDQLFAESGRAVESGAEIVFWSEVNTYLFPEDLPAFMERSQDLAREHGVYFSPAYAVLRYGEATADNMLVMINPDGEIAYRYEKTKSWYPTNSDGIIHSVETPYGVIASAICFDMDFPSLVHQAAAQNVDIMLVPAYDWEPIKPFHTFVGLHRGIENGFSVIRQTNEGTSVAIDYHGQTLAYQDYFDTSNPVMIVDLPTQGVTTPYGLLGDWFAYLNMLFVASILARVIVLDRARQDATQGNQGQPHTA